MGYVLAGVAVCVLGFHFGMWRGDLGVGFEVGYGSETVDCWCGLRVLEILDVPRMLCNVVEVGFWWRFCWALSKETRFLLC